MLRLALEKITLALILKGELNARVSAYSEISLGGVLALINLFHASLHSWMILRA